VNGPLRPPSDDRGTDRTLSMGIVPAFFYRMLVLVADGLSWPWRRITGKEWSWRATLRPGSVERRCGLAWLALVFAVWGWVDVRPRARVEIERPWEHQTDLTCYTEAGAAFFDGRPPYEVVNHRGWRYLYPPLLALLVAPLHALEPQDQGLIWFALSVVVAWGCMREAERLAVRCLAPCETQGERRVLLPVIAVAALLVALLPTLNCLQRGQVGVLKLYFLLLGFRLVCDAKAWPKATAGGVALAFAVTLKLTPLLPAAYLVGLLVAQAWYHPAERFTRVRACGAAAGISFGLLLFFFAVPSVLVGWEANLRHLDSWKREVLFRAGDTGHDSFAGNPHTLRNQSLSNAVYRLGNWTVHQFAGGPDDRRLDDFGYTGATPMDVAEVGRALGSTRLAILALLATFGVRMGRRCDRTGMAAGFGLACVATLVISPVARAHYFMLWLPAVIVVPIWLWRHERRRAALTLAATPAILTLLHYLALPTMGRLGVLGFGTTFWFLATISCMMATNEKPTPVLQPATLDEQILSLGHSHSVLVAAAAASSPSRAAIL